MACFRHLWAPRHVNPRIQDKYKNSDTVYQLDYFRCIISLTYKVTLFRIFWCANLLYIRKCPVRYFICQKLVKSCTVK